QQTRYFKSLGTRSVRAKSKITGSRRVHPRRILTNPKWDPRRSQSLLHPRRFAERHEAAAGNFSGELSTNLFQQKGAGVLRKQEIVFAEPRRTLTSSTLRN